MRCTPMASNLLRVSFNLSNPPFFNAKLQLLSYNLAGISRSFLSISTALVYIKVCMFKSYGGREEGYMITFLRESNCSYSMKIYGSVCLYQKLHQLLEVIMEACKGR